MLKFIVLLGLFYAVDCVLINCLNPWQTEMKSGTKNVACSATNSAPCQKGRNGVCVYTYVTFNYICCEDNDTLVSPTCPKYYDTLKSVCDPKKPTSCPSPYQCMFDTKSNFSICCSYNPNIKYPEPSSSFIDVEISPKYLSPAPTTVLKVANFKLGQNVAATDIAAAPPVYYTPKDNTTYYTIIAFDINADTPAAPVWVVVNARAKADNRTILDFTTGTTTAQAWTPPTANAAVIGDHVIAFALFEQREVFKADAGAVPHVPIAADVAKPWDVKKWLATSPIKDVLSPVLAGTYITYTTVAAAGGK